MAKLALWQNWRSGKTDWHFSKLALWRNCALAKLPLWQMDKKPKT
jgi:hypothetical protein